MDDHKDLIDIVLLDLTFPDKIPGTELIHLINDNKNFGKPSIVILTADTTSEKYAEVCKISDHIKSYLTKPFKFEELITNVKQSVN